MSNSNPEPHQTVAAGYNACSAAYTATRSQDEVNELALLTSRLRPKSAILDLGCGAGIPVASTLTSRHDFHVTGLDISSAQIARAKANVPSATFIQGDMADADDLLSPFTPQGGFDAVVAFFSVFHLPRETHAKVFERVGAWLRPGGYLLATAAASAEGGEGIVHDFYGADMYWSNYGMAEYRAMLQAVGLEVLENKVEGTGEVFDWATSAVDAGKAQHPLLFARKAIR
ncbi:uncharacterized protein HMPREF1541_01083 [Cyphellophora europaea CBS 101466]|uniref:Methyltransferase domain-containing protein n=1 Tax=Cyphellophora europaea (strain CBS 101466) TaxID=1220924 RepID=W2SGA2_CYPE1|nr:uncharacterized protein HMPREF1541_01083 [Cyphellophora europaea CBS 101466]ETN46894.1 hypothetical protein HMPREF1541_01083 [Cyphellophora europaea CBS 101466]